MSAKTEPPVLVSDPREVTADWLTDVLRHAGALAAQGRITGFDAAPIGTGNIGATYRYQLRYSGDSTSSTPPRCLVIKFSSAEENSRAAGVAAQAYESEVAFYRQVADTVDVRAPRCYYAAVEPGTANVVVVLADLGSAVPGDQLVGCDLRDAELAVAEAARLHGPRWGDARLLEVEWLASPRPAIPLADVFRALWPGFVEHYRARLEPDVVTQGELLGDGIERWLAHTPAALTITHSHFRIDNLMFEGADQRRTVTVVDWQTGRLGVGPADVSYLLGGSLPPEVRRAHETDLLRRYHRALEPYGVTASYSFQACWDDYRRFSWNGLVMSVIAGTMVAHNDRADAMFAILANWHAAHTRDLAAAEYLK